MKNLGLIIAGVFILTFISVALYGIGYITYLILNILEKAAA